MIWALLATCLVTTVDPVDPGQQVIETFDWRKMQDARQLVVGELAPAEQGGSVDTLTIDNPRGKPSWLTVFKLEKPKVRAPAFGFEGEVSYEGVEGVGELQLVCNFGTGNDAFTIPASTRGAGLSAPLRDKSPWRPFRVWLALGNLKSPPESLEFKVVLPGQGTVHLRNVQLLQYSANVPWLAERGIEWAKYTNCFVVVGAGIILLALQIVATAILIRGITTCRIALRLTVVGEVCGAAMLAAGLLLASQPRYNLLGLTLVGTGAVYMGAVWALVPWIHRWQGEVDLRRMPTLEVSPPE